MNPATSSEGASASGLRLALTGLALIGMGGCTTLGPDFETPEADIAAQWREAGDSAYNAEAVEREWWKLFNEPVLDQLVEIARAQNLSLQSAAVRILEARAQLGIATGNLYPQQQSLNASVVYQNGSENAANSVLGDLEFTDYNASFDANWEIDFWGKFRRGIESADAGVLASIADYEDVLVSLTADVAASFVLIRTFEERIAIALENVQIQQRGVEIATAQWNEGLVSELDVQQAQTLLFDTRASIPVLQTGLQQSRNALSILLGLPPGEVEAILGPAGTIPTPPAQVAVGIPNELLRRRPDVRRAELFAAEQSALIGVARADLYPSFSLFGSVGLLASSSTSTTRSGNSGGDELLDSDSLVFFGGPSVYWPIFNYGRLKSNVRVQDARFQQTIFNYQLTVLAAAREAEDSMTAFLKTREVVAMREQGAAAAERAVELALIQYREGTTDYTTVLSTQEALVVQQDQLVAARGNVVANLVALYKALGGGWEVAGPGADPLPEEIRIQMRDRTDWGGMLDEPLEEGSTRVKVAE